MNYERKKILFILPSLIRAGAETQIVNLVNELDSELFEKHLLVFEKNIDQINRINTLDVKFYRSERKHKTDITPAKKIAEIIEQKNIELVHCTLQIALLMGWIGIRLSKRKPKLVLAIHTTFNRNSRNELADKFLYQWLMRGCSTIIFVCKAQEEHWRLKYPFLKDKTKVVYNGIDCNYFDPKKLGHYDKSVMVSNGIPENAIVLCHVAGFRPEKGHLLLLDAFAKVVRKIPDAFLIFVGDGVLRTKVEVSVQEKGLFDKILFLGDVSDVRPVIAISQLSINASISEAFSLAILESMALGIPLVATDVGGTREVVVPGETGVIVPANDIVALADGIVGVLSDKVLLEKFKKNARGIIIQDFSLSNMVSKTAQVLLDVIQEQ